MKNIHAVTGAFGYTGRYIASLLLEEGRDVITLTNSMHNENIFGDKIRAYPLNFGNIEKMSEALNGVDVLYNTYWVRFNHRDFTHETAVNNTKALFQAAKAARVRKIIHISISNPDESSELEYFRDKAILEKELIASGMQYSILRPTVIFGKEDILINNICWVIRNFPVYGLFGDGSYKIQPVYVEDLAKLAYKEALHENNNIIDAAGPETFTFRELVERIMDIIEIKRPIIKLPPSIGFIAGKIIGFLKNDVIITKPEIDGLMQGLLATNSKPAGETKLTGWIQKHKDSAGMKYANELARRK